MQRCQNIALVAAGTIEIVDLWCGEYCFPLLLFRTSPILCNFIRAIAANIITVFIMIVSTKISLISGLLRTAIANSTVVIIIP